jgi:5-bromo-4-chloroindolyl phosphate hydrolysis protein
MSGLFALYGWKTWRLALRVRRVVAVLQEKNICTLEEMTEVTGQTPESIKKDLERATNKQMLSDVRLDHTETTIIYGAAAYRSYMDYNRNLMARQAAEEELLKNLGGIDPAELDRFRSEGAEALRRIRRANEDLHEPEISEKLTKLESITKKIINYVESHPNKLSQTGKFISYYLPTTLKLTDKYRQYDKLEGKSIKEAQEDIKTALDTITHAFHTLFEQLTEEDILDVSTDIKVLETILANEGLTEQKFVIGKAERKP